MPQTPNNKRDLPYEPPYPPYPPYNQNPIFLEIDRFFTLDYHDNGHGLENNSICSPLIRKNGQFYECIIHRVQNIHLEEIIKYCRYKDPEQHKVELLRLIEENENKEANENE